MPKKRISYEAMAFLGIAGGLIALAAVVAARFLPGSVADEPSVLLQLLGIVGFVAWFLGAGASVLTLSTRLSRWGIAGLVLSGMTAAALVLPTMLT